LAHSSRRRNRFCRLTAGRDCTQRNGRRYNFPSATHLPASLPACVLIRRRPNSDVLAREGERVGLSGPRTLIPLVFLAPLRRGLFFLEPIPAPRIVLRRKDPQKVFRNVPCIHLVQPRPLAGLFLIDRRPDIVLRPAPHSAFLKSRARIQPKTERTLAFLMAFGGTAACGRERGPRSIPLWDRGPLMSPSNSAHSVFLLVRCIWGTAAYVIREGHLSTESGRGQTARDASNGTVHQERIWKGGGPLDATRPTRVSRCRRKK